MIWNEFSTPPDGQFLLKLLKTTDYGNWSWVKDSESRVGIALELTAQIAVSDLPSSKYFEVSAKQVPLVGNILSVFCKEAEFHEIFEVLCTDLVKSALVASSSAEAVTILSNRILAWSKLFSKGFKGLTAQQVFGLAAEISFLKIWVTDLNRKVSSWTGPLDMPQDFTDRTHSKAVEVKAIGRTSQFVRISSLEQLDFEGDLVLAAFPIQLAGPEDPATYNLDDLVGEVSQSFSQSRIGEFNNLLLQAGYVADLYKHIKFVIQAPIFYKVRLTFPRLTRISVPKEVVSLVYDLDLNKCELFKIEFKELMDLMT